MASKFPRRSGAELYPGAPKYIGVGAIFSSDDGEIVVVAPNFTALSERTAKWGLPIIDREKCKTVEVVKRPDITVDEPAVTQGTLENPS